MLDRYHFTENLQLSEMKKDALSNKPAGVRVVDIVKLILILTRVATEKGLLDVEIVMARYKDISEYFREFVLLIVDGADPDYIIEYGSIHYYMSHDRGERFRIFVSLYLLLLMQAGDQDYSIWYTAKNMLGEDERMEISGLDIIRNEKLGVFPRSVHDKVDINKLYVSQDEINEMLSGINPDETKEREKPNKDVNEET